jgi:hypothetical protein
MRVIIFLLQNFFHLVGKKRKKKGKKKKANATSPKEFFGKNGPKSLITPRGFLFLFLFLFYEIAQSRVICSSLSPENYSILFLKNISTFLSYYM